jgi:hypothetical protein
MDVVPPKITFRYHDMVDIFEKWRQFTQPYDLQIQQKRMLYDMQKIQRQMKRDGTDYKEGVYIPSMIDYYNLFPKFIREHPTIQMIVRGIEFHNPFLTFQVRQHLLNEAAMLIFPLEERLQNAIASSFDNRMVPITLENVNELINYNYEDNKVVILPDDYYTDEEDLEGDIITAAMVRVWEKEEEEARKLKKREEGRAKRAAEEAKAAGLSVPKVDKAAEEKRKEEDDIKMMEEENQRLEEEKREEEERLRQEELERKRKIKLEVGVRKFQKRPIADQELQEDIGASSEVTGVKQVKQDKKENKKNEEEPENAEANTSTAKSAAEIADKQKKVKENEKRKEKREKQLRQGRKHFEDKTEEIRAERIEKVFAFIKTEQSMSLEEKISKIHTDYSKNEDILMHIYVSLMKSESFAPETKDFIKKLFNFDKPVDEIVKLLKKRDDERIKEYNLMMDLLDVTTVQMDTVNKYVVEDMYQLSLKEHENQIQNNEEIGLKDVWVKPMQPLDVAQRPREWQVPVDYYINDDGFWDGYIAAKRKNVDVRVFTEKPFSWYKDKLKKVEEDI